MKIPTGDFGFSVAQPAPIVDRSPIFQAAKQLGRAGAYAIAQVEERRRSQARSAAVNALLDDEVAVKTKAEEISDKVASGELDYDSARRTFDDEAAKLQAPRIDYLDPEGAEALDRGMKRTRLSTGHGIDQVVDQARRRDHQGQFKSALDSLGKLAGFPDADINDINRRADSLAEIGRSAGIPADQVQATVQAFKDGNWLNHATQRSMMARNDLNALKAMAKDLVAKDGFYAGKLDTDKRNAVLRAVQADQDRIENRIRMEAERHTARAERTINEIDRQIASGVPATSEMWANWATEIEGTELKEEFRARVKDEREVQELLRQPIDAQVKFVQDREAALLTGGGSVREAANVTRLKQAVQTNVNLLQQAPLLFSQNRTGKEFEPIDLATLASEDAAEMIAPKIRDRMIEIGALRREYGPQVQLKPLLPQEAQFLSTALEQASPRQATEMYSQLRQAIGGDETFRATMQQIAPDSPVKALAGMLAAKERALTLERNWISDDQVASSRDVSITLLAGEAIINRSKGQKAEDGKAQSKLFLPETTTLQDRFQDVVGNAFAGRPGAAEIAFQAVQAYYVGKASETGKLASDKFDIDSNLVRESVKATLGTVVDYNGNGEVLAPWGMDETTFENRVENAFIAELKRRKMPAPAIRQLTSLGLRNNGDGSYYVVQGRNFVYDGQGNPMTIDITE